VPVDHQAVQGLEPGDVGSLDHHGEHRQAPDPPKGEGERQQ
jgi:hypothetical protein